MFKINYNLKSLISIFLFMLISTLTFGQTENDPSKFLPNITPPSPEAFKFSLYGNTPVGLFTGTPNIQLPLFTYKTSNLNVSYNLNYSSSGIKVDDVNSKTGLGWNLTGGGIITRMVRNVEDNYYEDFAFKHLDIASINKTSAMQNVYFNLFGDLSQQDTEKDLYMFNFQNYSGKFFFDDNNNIVFLEKSDLKVQLIPTIGGAIFTFVITTPDGVKYFFQETEETMLNTYGAGHSPPSVKTTAWYLSKIVHPKGDEIYFTYTGLTQSYIQSESQQASRAYPVWQTCGPGQGYARGFTMGPVYSHNIKVIGKTIKTITSNNIAFGSVDFTYEDKILASEEEPDDVIKTITIKDKNETAIEKIDFDYLTTSNKRIFLNSFHFLEETNKYAFNYIDPTGFPARLSKSQDHWGYYNGAVNRTLLPKENDFGLANITYDAANREIDSNKSKIGLLSRIVYPTKGYTDFEYESNDYYGTKKILPALTRQSVNLNNDSEERHKETTITISPKFDYAVKFKGAATFGNCSEADNTGDFHYKGNVTVFCVEDNAYVGMYQYSDAYGTQQGPSVLSAELLKNAANDTYYFDVKQNKTYILKLSNDYNCTSSYINLEYYIGESSTINTNILTGGNRIKSTKDYAFSDSTPVIKKYYYSKFDKMGTSSGDVLQQPYYVNFKDHLDYDVNGNGCGVVDLVLNSSSVASIFEMGSNVFYKYVTVSNGNGFDNGYEENEFTVSKDYWEHIYLGDREFRNVPWSNLGWNNGKLVKTKIFEKKSNGYVIRKEIINNYLKDADNPAVTNFAISNPYPGTFSENIQEDCPCTVATTNEFYPVKYCTAIHFHQKDVNGNCIASGASNINYNIQHPCFGKMNVTIGIPTINHLDIMPYKYISYFVYLGSTVTNEYDRDGVNPITTTVNYNYNSPNHLQLTSQTTTNSKGETLETKYFYAKDGEMVNKPFKNELISSNMIGIPLDTQIYKGGTKISEQLTVYDKSPSTSDLLLPKSIYAAKFPNSLPEILNVGALEKKITFTQYDEKGNVVQYSIEGGIPTVIIWGYNKTQPIAKIENAVYSDVAAYVSNLQTKSDTGTEADLLTNLNNLRNALPAAMVTTYTYLPLIGISTVTDPKGNVTTYSYDEFNRLKTVKDGQGHIVSQNQYHYKN